MSNVLSDLRDIKDTMKRIESKLDSLLEVQMSPNATSSACSEPSVQAKVSVYLLANQHVIV